TGRKSSVPPRNQATNARATAMPFSEADRADKLTSAGVKEECGNGRMGGISSWAARAPFAGPAQHVAAGLSPARGWSGTTFVPTLFSGNSSIIRGNFSATGIPPARVLVGGFEDLCLWPCPPCPSGWYGFVTWCSAHGGPLPN